MNGAYIGPVNLGNPGEYTVLELAQAVQQMVNPNVPIKHEPLPQDDPRRRKPDITKARIHLDWQPEVALRDGLKLTIDDFQARMEDVLPTDAIEPAIHS